jgi:hypothetical protein
VGISTGVRIDEATTPVRTHVSRSMGSDGGSGRHTTRWVTTLSKDAASDEYRTLPTAEARAGLIHSFSGNWAHTSAWSLPATIAPW